MILRFLVLRVPVRYNSSNQNIQEAEVMCNLDKVPAAGAVVFAVFPPIEDATGLPARMRAAAEH